LITILDDFSRYIVHTELRASMKDEDVSVVIQAAKERFPTATPRIISDNGKQFLIIEAFRKEINFFSS
jgi:transposase InsO family protein